MNLPGSYTATLVLLILSLICLGSWANTFKASPSRWRFELYYFDFAIGALVLALIAALTLGTYGFDGFSFGDDIRLAGKRQDLFAFLGGSLFNLGNMLLVGGMSLAGMSVAFPIGLGLALAVSSVVSYLGGGGSLLFLLAAALALAGAAAVDGIAFHTWSMARLVEMIQQGKTKSTRRTVNMRGVTLSVFGGLLIGLAPILVNLARAPDIGLGPYSLAFVFAVGVALSTFVFNLFFMNLPIAGKPLEMVEFFRAKAKTHLPGLLGGVIWMAGMLMVLVAARVEGDARVSPPVTEALTGAAVLLTLLWGMVAWKEFGGTDAKSRNLMGVTLLLLLAGVGFAALAMPGR